MAGDAQDKPISGEDVESAVKTLMAKGMFLQPDILIKNLARWKDMSAHVTVSELLARLCFISWLKKGNH